MRNAAQEGAAVHKTASSASPVKSFRTGSECSKSAKRLILSALNDKKWQQIILD